MRSNYHGGTSCTSGTMVQAGTVVPCTNSSKAAPLVQSCAYLFIRYRTVPYRRYMLGSQIYTANGAL